MNCHNDIGINLILILETKLKKLLQNKLQTIFDVREIDVGKYFINVLGVCSSV